MEPLTGSDIILSPHCTTSVSTMTGVSSVSCKGVFLNHFKATKMGFNGVAMKTKNSKVQSRTEQADNISALEGGAAGRRPLQEQRVQCLK